MNQIKRADRELMRGINRSVILNLIKVNGPISRADIANQTGLSPATVTSITGILIKEDLVFEKDTGDSKGGRPPILLALNPRGGFVIGIKLMEENAVAALTDLNATILEKTTFQMDSRDLNVVIEKLVLMINNLITQSKIPKKRLLGVGIGLAGVVDSENGILRKSPYFGWKNVPLRNLLGKNLKVPIYLDNDVNTLTLGEKWLDNGVQEQDFIVITIGRGIGMGIVLNGQIFRGTGGGAGEFGHSVVDPNGPLCDCGKRGCLESFLGDRALLKSAKEEISSDIQTMDDLMEAVKQGNPQGLRLLSKSGNLLGQQIANLINILNPKLIILSGEGVNRGEAFFKGMHESLREHAVPELLEDAEIRISTWGDDVWARGAASLVIHEFYKSPVFQGPA